jgi:hypothetical protein
VHEYHDVSGVHHVHHVSTGKQQRLPQCADHLFDILNATVSFLEAKNFDYKIAFGTLLGAVL